MEWLFFCTFNLLEVQILMRRRLTAVVLSLFLYGLMPLYGQQLDTVSLVADITTANRWIKSNDPRRAAISLEQLIKKIPHDSRWADSVRYRVHRRLGVAYRDMGAIDQAFDRLDSAVAYASKIWGSAHHRVAFLYGQQGNVYYSMGDYENARLFYQKDLDTELATGEPRDRDVGIAHYNLANAHFGLLEYAEAEHHYQKALPLWKTHFGPDHEMLRWIYNSLGTIYWEREMAAEAVEYYQLAMEIEMKKQPTKSPISQTLKQGEDSLQAGKYKQALTYYFSELEARKQTFGANHPLTAGCYNYIAHAYFRQKDYQTALKYYHEAVMMYVGGFSDTNVYAYPDTFLQVPSGPYLFEALMGKAEAFAQRYSLNRHQRELESAYRHCILATAVIDDFRLSDKAERTKARWNSKVKPTYLLGIEMACQLYQLTGDEVYKSQAFVFAEKSKAFLLLTSQRHHQAIQYAGVPQSLIERERVLKEKIAQHEQFIFMEEQQCREADTLQVKLINAAVFDLKRELNILAEDLAQQYPAYYRLKYQRNVISPHAVQKRLLKDEKSALLAYILAPKKLYLFVITPSHIELYQSAINESFHESLEVLQATLSDIGLSQRAPQVAFETYTETSAQLYQLLLGPAEDLLSSDGIERIVVIPDGGLSYVPFGVLLTRNVTGSQRDYARLPYLLNRYTLSYAHSATLLDEQRSPQAATLSYLGVAPEYGSASPGIAQSRSSLAALTYNMEEVSLGKNVWGGKTLTAQKATEAYFKQQAASATILHLAMHTSINDSAPQYSQLRFYENSDSLEDGMLHTYELYTLELNASLAVLSACNTGTGKLQEGEGVLSLARGFSYAGCPSIAMSLWQIDDQATAQVIGDFFASLAKSESKDQALCDAKKAYLAQADPARAHPYYWAGMTLIGDRSPIAMTQSVGWMWTLLVLVVVGGGFWGWRKSKNK